MIRSIKLISTDIINNIKNVVEAMNNEVRFNFQGFYNHMITYLNDRDWLLRYAFFDSVVDVAASLGGRNLEEYIFPLMTQALSGK